MQATILVVDDTPNNIAVLTEILRGDYRVLAAINGDQALKIARGDSPPDLILLDIGLPTLNGIDAAHRIHRIAQGSRILFVSQESDSDVVSAALNTGGLGYLLKTDAGDELLPAVVAVLQGDRFLSRGLKEMIARGTTAPEPLF